MMKVLKRLGIWLTEAAISGAPMIPLFIYVTSFIQHEGALLYVLPFVLFYSFNKTGEFMLGIFGTVNNPYRLAQVGAVMVIVGACSSLLVEFNIFFSDIGATLVGLGTAIFGPMFRTLKETLRNEKKYPYGRSELVGFLIMTVLSALILLAQGRLHEVVIAGYAALSVICLLTLRSLDVDPEYLKKPLFIYADHDLKKGIPALFFLAIVLFLRLFKQTANVQDIMIVFLVSTAVIIVVVVRKTYSVYQVFEYHGVFYSEMLIYVILYDIFLFISEGNITAVLIVNVVQFAGQFLAMAFGKKILDRIHGIQESNTIIALTMAVGILFLFPFTITNYIAVFVIAFLTQTGHIRVSGLYHAKGKLSITQIYLTNQRMSNIGLVIGQAVLIGVMSVVSLAVLHNGGAVMQTYAFRISHEDLGSVFSLIQYICMGIFWAEGIVLLLLEKHKNGTVFTER